MSERPHGIPRHELEPAEGLVLPPDRVWGHYSAEDPVVVFAPLKDHLKSLKRGTIARFSGDKRCALVDLEAKVSKPMRGAARPLHGSRSAEERDLFVIRLNEPALMGAEEFELIRGNGDRIREWLQGMPDGRSKDALRRALQDGSVIETAADMDLGPSAMAQHLLR